MTPERKYATSPDGEKFFLPSEEDYKKEYARIQKLLDQARSEGREIVVVMGLGFMGAVMAGVVADSEDQDGKPKKFVIGCQRPSTRSFWKIPLFNLGVSPIKSEDPEVDRLISRWPRNRRLLFAQGRGTWILCLRTSTGLSGW